MRRRLPTAEELALWAHATRDVARRGDAAACAPAAPLGQAASVPKPPPLGAKPSPTTVAGLDRRTAQRLRRGRFPIEASLDLHGHTQASGHAALLAFLQRARGDGCRRVLVVTGRGPDGGGVLRRSVPRWLAEPGFARHVVGYEQAGPRHGGAGALYLVLRRGPPGA